MRSLGLAALLISVLAAPTAAVLGDDGGRAIAVWTRAPGAYDKDPAPLRLDERVIDLDGLSLERIERYDLQLERSATFVGLPLSRLLEKDPADAVLLHFANGMEILLPLDQL